MQRHDALVLGAGIVGVAAALHLRDRGLAVAMVDRGPPGGATSWGNAGFIERSTLAPHPFPRSLRMILAIAANRSAAVRADPRHLLSLAPWLAGYFRASAPRRLRPIAQAFRALVDHALPEHRALAEAAGAADLMRHDGWLELCRRHDQLAAADRQAEAARAAGIAALRLDAAQLAGAVPALLPGFAGAIHWADSARVVDPGAYVAAFAELFRARGGLFAEGDAMKVERSWSGWRLDTLAGTIEAEELVIALGPWSGDLAARLGHHLPLAVKRGYHRHFEQPAGAALDIPVFVRDEACLMVPTAAGIRLLSGVELAARDAAPSPVQIEAVTASARRTVRLGRPLDARPWVGSRPCLPDMLPAIGRAPEAGGPWYAVGHGHFGLTLAPVTGRLLADLMTGAAPFIDAAPYDVARFLKPGPR